MILFGFLEYKPKNVQSLDLTIHYALKPVIYLGFIFGIDKYSYKGLKVVPRTMGSKAYSWFLLCLLIGVYIHVIKSKVDAKYDLDLSVIIDNLAYTMAVFSAVTSIVCSLFFAAPSTVNYLNNIECIDKFLDLPPECFVKMRTNVVLILFLLLSYLSSVVLADAFTWFGGIFNKMSCIYLSMFVMDFLMFQYVLDIWIVTFRLRALVSLLICSKSLSIQIPNIDFSLQDLGFTKRWSEMNRYLRRTNNSSKYDEVINELPSIYDKLSDNVDVINSSYGIQVNILIT